MLFDHKIQMTKAADAYELHRLVYSTFKNEEDRNLFCDYGDHIRVRSSTREIEGIEGMPVEPPGEGSIALIELRASCYVSAGGRKYFLKQGDWKGRHEWLERKGSAGGFSVMTVTCRSSLMKIRKPGAEFTLDCTDFTACVKLEDRRRFLAALEKGVGSKGRAFGLGMIVL